MNYTAEQLAELMKVVESQFTVELEKAEENFKASMLAKSENGEVLAKAEDESKKDESKDEKKDEKKEEAAPESKEEAPKADEAKDAKPAEEAPAEEAAAPAAEEAAQEAAPAQQSDCDYDDEDHAHMNSMYSSMSSGELRAHHDAIKAALDAQGMQKCGDMSVMKSETDTNVEVPAEIVIENTEATLLKSELEAEKAKSEELKKSLDAVSEFLTKLVKKSAPQGKAITSMEVIEKSETHQEEKSLTKSEITQILMKKTADPSLSKSDRELINAYYQNGASTNTISHLLK